MFTMDAVSEARLALLHPKLADSIRRLADRAAGEGIVIRVVQGGRSWPEQRALWSQGRESLDAVNALRAAVRWAPITDKQNAATVTNAEPGDSWHNYFLAVDVAPDDPKLPGYQPDWNAKHPAWKRLVAIGEDLGLRSGIGWNDLPHFELTGQWPAKPTDEVKQLFKDGGVQAVWDELQIAA